MGGDSSQYYSVKEAAYAQVMFDDGADIFTSLFRRSCSGARGRGNLDRDLHAKYHSDHHGDPINHTIANDRTFPNPGSKFSDSHIRADPDHCGHQYDHTGPNRHVIPSRSGVFVCGYLGEQDLLGKL